MVFERPFTLPPFLTGRVSLPLHKLMVRGHDVRLVPARSVKPFVKPKMVVQLDLQALYRVRSRLAGQRNAAANQIRAVRWRAASPSGRSCASCGSAGPPQRAPRRPEPQDGGI